MGAEHRRVGRGRQVGVVEHDLWTVAGRLDDGALHPRRGDDGRGGGLRTHEPDPVHAGMGGQSLAHGFTNPTNFEARGILVT